MNIYKLLTLSLREKIGRLQKQTYNFKILACEYGQWRTVRDWDCRDVNGDEMPWYTYPAFEFLSHLDLSSFRVFEFGSGNSTIWWAKQARFVHSVENDTKWFEHVNLKIKVDALNSVTYELKNDKKTNLDALNQEFDITIIDGKYRSDCTEQYFEFSKNGFMLIFDNSDWYPDSIKKSGKN